jgi:hypothetical protein
MRLNQQSQPGGVDRSHLYDIHDDASVGLRVNGIAQSRNFISSYNPSFAAQDGDFIVYAHF